MGSFVPEQPLISLSLSVFLTHTHTAFILQAVV